MCDECKVYGPYTATDGRQRIILRKDGISKTMSFPRYLIEQYLGRQLCSDEDVHHKDGNPRNNALSNLELIKHSEHCREHSTKYRNDLTVLCCVCNTAFVLTTKQQRKRKQNKRKYFCCSRKCSGMHGKSIQMGTSG